MKWLLKSGLCLALGWAATPSDAQEVQWRAAAPPTRPAAPGVVQPALGTGGSGTVQPVISLSAPVPFDNAASDVGRPGLGRATPLVRGQSAEDRPLPSGPSLTTAQGPSLLGDGSGGKIMTAPPPRPVSQALEMGAPMRSPSDFTGPPPQVMPAPSVSGAPGIPGTMVAPQTQPGDLGSIWGGTVPFGTGGPSGALGFPGNGAGDCGSCGSCCDSGCGASGCDFGCCQNPCGCPQGFWVGAEYLLWFTRGQNIPPLVTTSSIGTPRLESGVLGFPSTNTAVNSFNNDPRSGGRFSLGYWFPNCCGWGVDGSIFFLGTKSDTIALSGLGDPNIARPLVDVNTGNEIAQLVAFPGVVTGSVTVHDYSQFWGGDLNLRKRLCCGCNYWLDGLIGYRYLELKEGIDITENLNVLNTNGSSAGQIVVRDSFHTQNRFNGAQLGLQGQYNFASRWFLGGTVKVAMGSTNEQIDINGSTTFSNFTNPLAINGTRPAGILALPSNIGHYSSNNFAVSPQVGMKVGYNLTDNLSLFVGYDFLYISSVVRPGDQIDRVINRSQIPVVTSTQVPALIGAPRPAVLFKQTDFWAQGVSFGLQYKY